ncbi:MAG TPA: chemotaxis protein CheW [Burkholderiaceae bacterium]|nr:chemotaxis protein CheW [Burkholderiaceae bacterium]
MATSGEATNRQLVKLREFSTQLAQRLKEAPNKPVEPTRLAVRIGAENYLIEMGLAGEIVSLPDIAPVPWTRPWYRGLANVRGRLIGVVDLLHLMGREPLAPDQTQQVLVFGEVLGVNAGILVTRAFGIRNLKDLTPLDGTPPMGRASWEHARYRDNEGLTMTALELRELATSAHFAAIAV